MISVSVVDQYLGKISAIVCQAREFQANDLIFSLHKEHIVEI